jgi:subtilase family serine protease
MPIRVYLAGRSAAAEERFANAAATPGTAAYGKYLTPAQFQARFGAAKTQVAAVEAWAEAHGLTVTGRTPNYIALTGTAPAVSTALDTTIDSYSSSTSGLTGYAPVKGISVPASIGADITTVVGLDYYSFGSARGAGAARQPGSPAARAAASRASFACSSWWGQHVSSIPKAEGHASAPDAVCGYTPQQLRSAYGVSTGSGKGATIAVVLDGSLTSMEADANRFFAAHHLPGFAPGQFVVNTGAGFRHSCGTTMADVPEEPLDVETLHIIAPKAKIVYVAANCLPGDTPEQEEAFLDAETRLVDQHLADVETDSYSTAECLYTPAMAAAWGQIMERGAVEGIGFNFDSGDGGDNAGSCGGNAPAVAFPASDPWASAVGGTTLEIGQAGAAVGDLGWGDNTAQENKAGTGYLQAPPGEFSEGSTGGRSVLFAEPAYQRGVVPASLATQGGKLPADRVVPDIAADASPMTGWLIAYTPPGGTYQQTIEGGTSGSSPIVAALEADAKGSAGHAIGFANPLLYALRHSAGILDVRPPASPAVTLAPNCYNDPTQPVQLCLITLGLDSSLRVTAGYDDVTGVGTPTSRFIATIAKG